MQAEAIPAGRAGCRQRATRPRTGRGRTSRRGVCSRERPFPASAFPGMARRGLRLCSRTCSQYSGPALKRFALLPPSQARLPLTPELALASPLTQSFASPLRPLQGSQRLRAKALCPTNLSSRAKSRDLRFSFSLSIPSHDCQARQQLRDGAVSRVCPDGKSRQDLSTATDSRWKVCGNRSTRRRLSRRYPECNSVCKSRAKVAGSQET